MFGRTIEPRLSDILGTLGARETTAPPFDASKYGRATQRRIIANTQHATTTARTDTTRRAAHR